MVNITVYHKPLMGGIREGNYRKTFSWNNIDLCRATEIFDSPLTRPLFEYTNKISNGILHKCPYGPGYIRITNASINEADNDEFDRFQVLPNGFFKSIWILFNNEDENIISGTSYIETNLRKNVLSFNDKF